LRLLPLRGWSHDIIKEVKVQERAVRMVPEHEGEYDSQWAAISSVASKLGMTSQTLRKWVR
jgi:transposase